MKLAANLLMPLHGFLYSEIVMSPCKIHDFLPQYTVLTHSRYLFFGNILGKSYCYPKSKSKAL